MKMLIGIQARSNSERFPGKIYEDLQGLSVLEWIYESCKLVNPAPKVLDIETKVLGTKSDERLEKFCKERGLEHLMIDCPEDNVIQRYMLGANGYEAILRVTADCPFLTADLMSRAAMALMEADYVTNVSPRTYPDGHDIQGASTEALRWYGYMIMEEEHCFWALENSNEMYRQFTEQGYTVKSLINPSTQILNPYHPLNKLSIDTPADLERGKKIAKAYLAEKVRRDPGSKVSRNKLKKA